MKAVAATLAFASTLAAQSPVRPADEASALIAAYDRRDFATFEGDLKRLVNADLFLSSYSAAVAGLPPRSSSAQAVRARLVAAAVAVEAAAHFFVAERVKSDRLLELACGLVYQNPPSEAERAWHRAALSVLQASQSRPQLEVHVEHALDRFDGDPHFLLARAVATELGSFPDPRDGLTPSDREGANPLRTVGLFEDAMKHAEVRGEAAMRLGYFWLRLRRVPEAVQRLGEVDGATRDPYVRYLAFLMLGRAYDRLDKPIDAIQAYERATREEAGAQTAAVALAAALTRAGRIADAERVALAAMTRPAAEDPWLSYGVADARHWMALRTTLRGALQ